MATVRVKEATFRGLCAEAGRLQAREGRPLALGEVVARLLRQPPPPSAYAGTWRMSKDEEARLFRDLEKAWHRWKPGG